MQRVGSTQTSAARSASTTGAFRGKCLVTSSVRSGSRNSLRLGPRCPPFCAASSSERFADTAREFATTAQQRMRQFAEEQKLQQRAEQAKKEAERKLKEAYSTMEDTARRQYVQLDSEYNLSEKAEQTKRQMTETIQDFDQQYSVRRRVRALGQDVLRKLPLWQKQATQFFGTPPGRVVMFGLVLMLFYTGVAWHMLHLFLLLWWLSVPLSLLFMRYISRQQSAAFKAAAERMKQQRQSGSGNFYSRGAAYQGAQPGYGNFWGAGPAPGQQAPGQPQQQKRQEGGPVIDAEWTVIDSSNNKPK